MQKSFRYRVKQDFLHSQKRKLLVSLPSKFANIQKINFLFRLQNPFDILLLKMPDKGFRQAIYRHPELCLCQCFLYLLQIINAKNLLYKFDKHIYQNHWHIQSQLHFFKTKTYTANSCEKTNCFDGHL